MKKRKIVSFSLALLMITSVIFTTPIISKADNSIIISSTNGSTDYQTVTYTTAGSTSYLSQNRVYYYFGTNPNFGENDYVYTTGGFPVNENYTKSYKVTDSGTYYYGLKVTYTEDYGGGIPVKRSLIRKADPITFHKTTLKPNGGKCSISKVIVEDGKKCIFPQATREGYLFRGWSEASWATSGIASYVPTGDDIYYACWEPDPNYNPPTESTTAAPPKSISDCNIILSNDSYTYDGTEKKPSVTVTDNSVLLNKDTDYTVEYFDNKNAGIATVVITGTGKYNSSVTKNFSISAKSVKSADIILNQNKFVFDGNEKKPDVTVMDGEVELESDTDYTVEYSDNKNVGEAAVTVKGKGNYTSSISKSFYITAKAIDSTDITLGQSSFIYDGSEKTPEVTVKDGEVTLSPETDYSINYLNNKNIGTATVLISGKGNYNGFTSKNFYITEEIKPNIENYSISLSENTYIYDSTAKTPSVTIKNDSETLVWGTDYKVEYINNINAGKASVAISALGDYIGNVTKTFTIKPKSISNASLTLSDDSYTYDGNAKRPSVIVEDGSEKLVNGTDYYVSYKDNKNVGTAKAIVSGIGNYDGSAEKEFTIKEAPKTDIADCEVTLSQNSYTYDGTEKKPAATVKYKDKALAQDTDFKVTYENNINVGKASAIIEGINNYNGSITKEFEIVDVKPEFKWSNDNWNFINSTYNGYFKDSTYREQINESYLKTLKNNLTNSEYEVVFEGSCCWSSWLDEWWGGSCYGMSSTALLSKQGLFPYSDYKSGAVKLNDLNCPNKDEKVSSLVTYYQMLQVKDVIQQQYRTVPYKTNETNIKEIIKQLENNPTVLIGFQKDGWGGHAVLATDYEYGSYTFNGVAYQGCIKICDPNCSMNYDKNYNIYFNTQTYNWTIPAYSVITSVSGAKFNYIGAKVEEINEGGYLNGTSENGNDSFVARIDADKISDNRTVTKVKESNGSYIKQNAAPGDIIEDYSYILGDNPKGKIGYNLYDSTASYKVSQDDSKEIQLQMDYADCNMTGGSKAGDSVLFDQNGYIQVEGEAASYNMSMTFDNDYPTDWFNIEVKGEGANNASLQKTDNGYILSSDSLNNVEVYANNKNNSAVLSFSTDYDTVFLFEIDETTLGVLADTDNNGTYETRIKAKSPDGEPATSEPTEPETTEPVQTTPIVTNPITTEPTVTTPIVTDPITTDPAVTEPSTPSAVIDPTQPSSTSSTSKVTYKKSNPIKVTAKTKTVKAKKLKKKAQTVKAITVKGAQGKVSYKLLKSGITKKIRKLVKINSKGVITIKKWKKAKKGTYKIKVTVKAAGNANYKAKTITKVVKVKIK